MTQLSLPIKISTHMTFANYIEFANSQIVQLLKQELKNNTTNFIYLWGNSSSGKTHLLQASALAAIDNNKKVAYLDFNKPIVDINLLDMINFDLICLDNIDNLNDKEQRELFELYNKVKLSTSKLIVSAKRPPKELEFSINDIKTRLSFALTFHLKNPNDEEKKIILEKKATAKGLIIKNNIYKYLLNNQNRDLKFLLKIIDKIDKKSIQEKKPITLNLLKQVLADYH